jgi:poly(3-hydroxybutyrate) depolymerase
MGKRFILSLWLLCATQLVACSSAGTSIGPALGAAASPAAQAVGAAATPSPKAALIPAPKATGTPSAAPTATPTGIETCLPGSNPTTMPIVRNPVALPTYKVDPAKVFVAGVSSGGFFGVQMDVAHSATFKGAAIYAGGVYYCPGQGQSAAALADCGGETNVNCQALYESELSASETYLDEQSAAGTIDPENNLKGQLVYLWSGTKDQVVNPKSMADLASEYEHYGAKVATDFAFPSNHGWESPNGDVPCPTATEPYMIKCTLNGKVYDSEAKWLTRFFGTLEPRNDGVLRGSLINFDQTPFGAAASNSMDTNGWLFVPQACRTSNTCGFVLALHGCIQNQAIIGNDFVTKSGIDQWADTNNFIVMYPYAVESDDPVNPMGCWDWWGYDDANYALKSGTQISIVYKMVQHVTGLK